MALTMYVHGAALTGLKKYPEAEKLLLGRLEGLNGAPTPRAAEKVDRDWLPFTHPGPNRSKPANTCPREGQG
jgi:hypothetical protein